MKRHIKFKRQIIFIKKSNRFDENWYLEQYPDVAATKCDPIKHYVLHGAKEKRNPNPFFDTKSYLDKYPDINDSELNPFYHYLKWGEGEGREICSADQFSSNIQDEILTSQYRNINQEVDYIDTLQQDLDSAITKCNELEDEKKLLYLQLHQVREELEN